MYRNRKITPQAFPYFIPADVGGYPAVFTSAIDLRNAGECGIVVGTSKSSSFSVEFSSFSRQPRDPHPCTTAHAAASTVLRNLKNEPR